MKNSNLLIITLLLFLISCGTPIRYFSKNIVNNVEGTATIGSEIITWEEGNKIMGGNIVSAVRRTLVYGGSRDSIVNIHFREYYIVQGEDYPKFAFDQDLEYNLKESDIILYNSLRIKVISAESQIIKFIILDAPSKPIINEGA